MPPASKVTVAPLTKPVPSIVASMILPSTAAAGVSEVTVGAANDDRVRQQRAIGTKLRLLFILFHHRIEFADRLAAGNEPADIDTPGRRAPPPVAAAPADHIVTGRRPFFAGDVSGAVDLAPALVEDDHLQVGRHGQRVA